MTSCTSKRLSDDDRRKIPLMREYGLSHKEIADLIGTTISTSSYWSNSGYRERRLANSVARSRRESPARAVHRRVQNLRSLSRRSGHAEVLANGTSVVMQYARQGGRCAICGRSEGDLERSLHIDHDHETGEFRGLLCGSCNKTVGVFEKNKTRILEYIKCRA